MVLPADHHRLGDRRVAFQDGFDLRGLDPEAADLELVVGAAEVFQVAVRCPAGQVAGAVHAGARRAVRVGGEAFGGQRRAVEVAPGQAGAGKVEFAGYAGENGAEGRVQDVRAGVGDRAADDGGRGVADSGDQGVDGRLGGAVQVEGLGGLEGRQAGPECVGYGLAADADDGERAGAVLDQARVDHLAQEGRGDLDEVQSPGADRGDREIGVTAGFVVHQVQGVAVQ